MSASDNIQTPEHESCPFCDYLSGAVPCAFVSRGAVVSVFMNRAQYEKGAVLLVPNQHLSHMLDLPPDVLSALYVEAQRIARGVIRAFGAEGFNLFQNNGTSAGQTIGHSHTHLVPRFRHSDSRRIFREEEFPHTPLHELEALAEQIRRALDGEG